MASVPEQETTVTGFRKGSDSGWLIWTADPVHIRGLDKRAANGQVTVIGRGEDWAQYSVDAAAYDPLKGFRRAVNLSDAERARRAERMERVRNG